MKNDSNKTVKKVKIIKEPLPYHHDIDLFGTVIVRLDDIEAWMRVIPAYAYSARLFNYYIKNWSVVAKIRGAKLDGSFNQIQREYDAKKACQVDTLTVSYENYEHCRA